MLPTITVDVGTTSVKLCMFDADGAMIASARHATPTVNDTWGEIYDVNALEGAVSGFVRQLHPEIRRSVRRIAITGVGESGGLVRPDISLASPMILWHDHRGAEYLSSLGQAERVNIYRTTGLPVNANYGLSKIAWAITQAGGAGAGSQWLNIAEYLAAVMTGERWSEFSLASRTMALDLRQRTWSAAVCAHVGIDTAVLPQLRPATHGSTVTTGYAGEVGLTEDVVVHVAGHDHMVGAIGSGLERGELLNSTGTTEGLLVLQDTPSFDERSEVSKLANGISCTGADYTLFASIPTGGSAFATLQTMLGLDAEQLAAHITDLHDQYLAERVDLSMVPLVLPHFRGSPPPTKRAAARGIISGLRNDTSSADVVLGCFLGMALQFRDVLELFPVSPGRIKVIGPASANPLWLQLKADLLGTPLSVSRVSEVVSRGAQALASGVSSDWSSCQPDDVLPDVKRNTRLLEWYDAVQPQWHYLKGLPE